MKEAKPDLASRAECERSVGPREWVVPRSTLPSLRAEVSRLSRALERAGGKPLALIETCVDGYELARVRIDGDTATLGGWEIVAIVHHDGSSVRVEQCGPLPVSRLERLGEARALCEVCRTIRPRRRTWILRERTGGETKQVGSSCLKPLTGTTSVEGALRRAQALVEASAWLSEAADRANRKRPGPGERYIDRTAFLAHVAAVIRELGWHPASDADPTWQQALQRAEQGATPDARDLQRAQDVLAWAATLPPTANEYRARLGDCLARERLTSRELPLAASGVRTYNRALYWAIRRRRAVGAASAGVRTAASDR